MIAEKQQSQNNLYTFQPSINQISSVIAPNLSIVEKTQMIDDAS